MRSEGLGKLKTFTSSGIEPATSRLAAYTLSNTLPRVIAVFTLNYSSSFMFIIAFLVAILVINEIWP
jgi:hypothetical protein